MSKIWLNAQALIEATVALYNGIIHGDDEYWLDVEFPNLVTATEFIRNYDMDKIARIRSDENGVSRTNFTDVVVIQFQIKEA